MRLLFTMISWVGVWYYLYAQEGKIIGTITDKNKNPLTGVSILIEGKEKGTFTSDEGQFILQLPNGKYNIIISHIGFKTKHVTLNINPNATYNIKLKLKEDTQYLEKIDIIDKRGMQENSLSNEVEIDPKSIQNFPSAFGDFSKIIVTLPGVSSNNEFSTGYSVRGGNFDENLVYVNDIPVYRPFLSNAGQQEGLSFVNTQLVSNIRFSAGGWEAKYGDKLSSSLNILYQEPDSLSARLSVGLLGGTATFRHKISNRIQITTGIRHKDSRYLLSTTDVKGQYFPTYTDFQSLLTFDLTSKKTPIVKKTKLHWLVYFARNRYLTKPESQRTSFGTLQNTLLFETDFQGIELLNYDVFQTGLNFSHLWSENWLSRLIVTGVYTKEREYFDIEGAYRLCDVNSLTGDPNECVTIRGLGSNYQYGRNQLWARLGQFELRNEYLRNVNNMIEWGVGARLTQVGDALKEYEYLDSVGYIQLTHSIFNNLRYRAYNLFAYVQQSLYFTDSLHALILGSRWSYFSYNQEHFFSPRLTYRFSPKWKKKTLFSFSAGAYNQFPFYREFRNFEGQLNENIKAQKSIHCLVGIERELNFLGRALFVKADFYYKYLYDIIPYTIDNLKLRYFTQNQNKGFVTGIDVRLYGEFIKGIQSWFSFSYMQARENLDSQTDTYIRRPLDQRIKMALFFEDHIPNDPSLRIYIQMQFGTGYPTGPPEVQSKRTMFKGDEYYRADIGISKYFFSKKSFYKSLCLRAEVLNALGVSNTLSYHWINDLNQNSFAIPNALSARFLNLKLIMEF